MQTGSQSRRPSALAVMFAPLRVPVFRRIWSASLLSNLGLLIGSVGAAWAMTQLTTSIAMVALVQTAAMLPGMLIALPAGAIADMFDRRKVAMSALTLALVGAASLATLSALGHITPMVLLVFIFIIGCGTALFSPAWQSSVSEQVPANRLPAAIGLTSISYNIARSFGPAVGGLIVATWSATAAFGANALFYLPLMTVLFLWRRAQEPSRLPPERLGRAILSGMRYVMNSPPIRTMLTRVSVTASIGGCIQAMMPLIARTLLHGDARLYGVILGCFGLGAVVGAFSIHPLRRRFGPQTGVAICNVLLGSATVIVGLSHTTWLTAPALVVAGASWMITITSFNIGIQVSAPRWVSARAVATYQTAVAGGVAIGSWVWGQAATSFGVGAALIIAGCAMLTMPILGLWLRMPSTEGLQTAPGESLDDPEVNLAITGRSGPIIVLVEYRVDPADARAFYGAMQNVELSRKRNGAYGWSIARDITDPAVWSERFHCPTWHDFLRLRDRPTRDDIELQERARAFLVPGTSLRIRRMLERPFGSVRWTEEVPDPETSEMPSIPASATGG